MVGLLVDTHMLVVGPRLGVADNRSYKPGVEVVDNLVGHIGSHMAGSRRRVVDNTTWGAVVRGGEWAWRGGVMGIGCGKWLWVK